MSLNSNLKLALVLALALVGPACNNQKAEQTEEEETADAQSGTAPTRDNRSSQSGDAAFIKIFPDGDIVVSRGETATVSAPAAASSSAPAAPSSTGETAAPAQDTPAPAESPTAAPQDNAPAASEPATSSPTQETPAAPATETPATPSETASQPAADPIIIVNEPAPAPAAAPAPAPAPAPAVSDEHLAAKDPEDTSRPVLTLNESTASTIISVLPKENKSIVAIGKHSDFAPGPYMILAKWSNDSKKVKVNVTSMEAKEKNCAIDENANQGEWKSIGVFYLTKNAKVVITNAKNSSFSVKNELLLKPVIAENVNAPSKFKCLDGQIDGQGLLAFP